MLEYFCLQLIISPVYELLYHIWDPEHLLPDKEKLLLFIIWGFITQAVMSKCFCKKECNMEDSINYKTNEGIAIQMALCVYFVDCILHCSL